MIIDEKAKKYLLGKDLSSGDWFGLNKTSVIERNELLGRLVRNKKVIHVGCADHIPLIRKKRDNGTYLHDRLLSSAASVFGLDTNQAAIKEMAGLGIENLFTPEDFPIEHEFDVLLAPDVIEHVPCVSTFLEGMKKYKVVEFIFTTPNAYRLLNRRLFNRELINTDHRYWFTPYTLAKNLYDNGFEVTASYYTDRLSFLHPIQSILKIKYPLCREGIVHVARLTR